MNINELIEKHAKAIGCPENDGPPSQSWVKLGVQEAFIDLLEMVKEKADFADTDLGGEWHAVSVSHIDEALEELRK